MHFILSIKLHNYNHANRQLAYKSGDDRPVWLTQVNGAEVTDILKWTSDGFIYYMSTLPNKPGTRHLFRIQFRAPPYTSTNHQQQPECVTCNRTMEDLGQCVLYALTMFILIEAILFFVLDSNFTWPVLDWSNIMGWFPKIGRHKLGKVSNIGHDRTGVGRWVKKGSKKLDVICGRPIIDFSRKSLHI